MVLGIRFFPFRLKAMRSKSHGPILTQYFERSYYHEVLGGAVYGRDK